MNSALAFPLFESGALLLTDRWLILGERRHPRNAPVLTRPDRVLSARLIPEEDEEMRLLLTFGDNTGEEWDCRLTPDEAARLKSVWSHARVLREIGDDIDSYDQ